jgi:stage V sporulation protein B
MSDQPKSEQPATGAGRGVLYIAFAKLYFLFIGLFIQFRLPAVLSTAAFGKYQLVNNVTSLFNNVAVTGTIQSVSRYAAQEPGKAREVQAAGLRLHLRLGLPIAVAFIAAAPLVAWLLHDMSKTAPLMLAGAIIGLYSFYAVFVGTANGLRLFHKQAGLDITFATLRASGMLGLAIAGFGVLGVIAGWVAAAGLILIVAIAWVGLPGKTGAQQLPVRSLVDFLARVAVYLLLFNFLMFVDGYLLEGLTAKYFEGHAGELANAVDRALPWAPHVSGFHPSPGVLADVQNAYYGAVQNVARVSYQLLIAVTFVVFPLVSRSTFTDDKETTRRYIQLTLRYSLAFAMAFAVIIASRPVDVLGLLYAPDYAELGGPALPLLAFGYAAFSIFAIAGTILNGAGRPRPAITSAAITLALAGVGNYVAIPLAAESGRVLEVTAAVTAGAMVLGAVITSFQLRAMFSATLPLASLVRILIAGAGAFAVGRVLPLHGKVMTLAGALIVGATYLVLLVATRELGKRDLEAIRAVRKKRGTAAEGEP